jgi:hypothetical protein
MGINVLVLAITDRSCNVPLATSKRLTRKAERYLAQGASPSAAFKLLRNSSRFGLEGNREQ